MANVFTKQKDPVNHPKRNVFDLSFQNNLTMQIGGLYPVFCKEVIPGDSFSIKPVFGLRFMPMTFPIQTRMRANLHFFYVRNRNLWADWQDFIGMTPTEPNEDARTSKYVPPYSTNVNITRPQTGSLADYLGVPTTMVGRYGQEDDLRRATSWSYNVWTWSGLQSEYPLDFPYNEYSGQKVYLMAQAKCSGDIFRSYLDGKVNFDGRNADFIIDTGKILNDFNVLHKWADPALLNTRRDYDYLAGTTVTWTVTSATSWDSDDIVTEMQAGVSYTRFYISRFGYTGGAWDGNRFMLLVLDDNNTIISTNYVTFSTSDQNPSFAIPTVIARQAVRFVLLYNQTNANLASYGIPVVNDGANPSFGTLLFSSLWASLSGTSVVVGLNNENSPFGDPAQGFVPISTLPFRAYESIYNCFYRDPRNNPYYLDGFAEYNKWIPRNGGGADPEEYPLHYRNWEADFLTTCVQSPQQGKAPLVGMTSNGTLTFADEDGTRFTAQLDYNEDGSGVKGITLHSSTEPLGVLTRLDDIANYGFTINDLRGVNALQRWLEINMRRGFRYKDQVKSHFDVDIRFDELDMPEFIGGTSCPVNINMISQTISQGDTGSWQDALGSYAGQGFAVGDSEHAIRHYCDEHGFIIGILSVSPVPNYSQLMPKYFLKRLPLDYYFPEFGHLGMQPVCYDEVCPVQAYNAEGKAALKDVFGYQRAWYDYLSSVDEVHGSFREALRNFLMNRIFENKPQLSEDFLLIDPEQVNQVFSVTESTDKILGQVWFDVKAKRPIPEYGIPSLE